MFYEKVSDKQNPAKRFLLNLTGFVLHVLLRIDTLVPTTMKQSGTTPTL